MDSARLTDQRLRSALNSDQASRERMCFAILSLDRRYTEINPRRPEGGRDGGRDIECQKDGELCFGAVGFVNNACDSPDEKRQIKRKYEDDVKAARENCPDVKAFVFFTNIDLTPSEVSSFHVYAQSLDFSFVDIYWRERIRCQLDSVEGLAFRFQYLQISLSEAEQASFFSRFGKDIEALMLGRFERIEKRLDEIDFGRWKSGYIRGISLRVDFNGLVSSRHLRPEHFRICLELQGVYHEKRNIFLGVQDDFLQRENNVWHFGHKTFFWKQGVGEIEKSWIPHHVRVSGGEISGINTGVIWRPRSLLLASEFDGLRGHFHFTENILNRIARIRFSIDEYLFIDHKLNQSRVSTARPGCDWPNELDHEQINLGWVYVDCGGIDFDHPPKRIDGNYY